MSVARQASDNQRIALGSKKMTFAFGGISNPLPVTFLKFAGVKVANNVNLSWSTSNEVNNEKFVVESSFNGHDFTSIGEVSGSGTTNDLSEYSYSVLNPESNAIFYRLRQVDLDGKSEVSSVIVVSEVQGVEQVGVYPNPCLSNNLNLSYSGIDENGVEVTIFDLNEKIHYSESFDLLGSGNIHLNNVNNLTQGIYYVTVKTQSKLSTIKLVVE